MIDLAQRIRAEADLRSVSSAVHHIVFETREDYEGSFLLFTFGSTTIDLATAPQDTRLRRAISAYLAGGGELCSGRCLLLRTDLSRFGEQPYRRASEQAIAHLLNDR